MIGAQKNTVDMFQILWRCYMKDGQVKISKREEFLISILEMTSLKHSQSVDDTNNKQIIFQWKTYFRIGKYTFTKVVM